MCEMCSCWPLGRKNWKDQTTVWGGTEGEGRSVFHRDLVWEKKIWRGHAYRSVDKTLSASVHALTNTGALKPKTSQNTAPLLERRPKKLHRAGEKKRNLDGVNSCRSCKNVCSGRREKKLSHARLFFLSVAKIKVICRTVKNTHQLNC